MKQQVIAFVLPEYALPVPAVQGGAIETLTTMLLEQNEKEQKFHFVIISPNGKRKVHSKTEYRFADIYYLPAPKNKNKMQEFFAKVYIKIGLYFSKLFPRVEKYYRQAYKIVKKTKADFVIAEGVQPRECIIFSQRLGKERVALHLHHHFARQEEWDNIFGKYIAVSSFIEDEWEKGFAKQDNVYLWRNCVDVSLFDRRITPQEREKMREGFGFQSKNYVVLFCGRIVKEKGVKELIHAVLSIKDENVKLLIAGSSNFAQGNSGEYAEEVEKLVEENKERIRYTGYLPNHELYKYYQCADIQVIPSLCEEAAGLVALEGALSGLPLIITRSGGMVEYVDEGYTEIVEKDTEVSKHIQEKIEFLRVNPKRCEEMEEKACIYARKYSAEYYYQQFSEMMREWINS